MNNTSHVEKSYVEKSELLYRRILSNKCNKKTPPQYTVEDSENIRITSAAFLGGEKPSVYRQKLVGKPECIDRKPTEGIISIKAVDIKAIKYGDYTADVEITPSDDNPAHAEIVFTPEPIPVEGKLSKTKIRDMQSDLRDDLARKATCVIKPNPLK